MTAMAVGVSEVLAELPDAYRRWRSSQLGRITDALEERVILDLAGSVKSLRVLDAIAAVKPNKQSL